MKAFILAVLLIPRVYAVILNSTTIELAWIPQPRGRGTWGLLFNCVFTIILCVWTAIHPDILPNGTGRHYLLKKIEWMVYALIVPELIILRAYHQWSDARKILNIWRKKFTVERGEKDRLGMGGAFFAVMGGFTYDNKVMSSSRFAEFINLDCRTQDTVDHKAIRDKGKSDTVGKFLAVAQAFSIVVQCIFRKAQGLPVTLLEIHVIVQVLGAGAMYGFWWYKPLNVREPLNLAPHAAATLTREISHGRQGHDSDLPELFSMVDIPTTRRDLAPYFCMTLYGAAHCIAWNSPYPTSIEQLLWRVSCLSLIAAPLLISTLLRFYKFLDDILCQRKEEDLFRVVAFVVMLYTVFPRAYLVVEPFVSLRSLPIGTYQTVLWEDYWPHM